MSPADRRLPAASRAQATRDRILDVAEALFAARGYAGAAIRDIAREAELTPASLYNHFAGKRALYEAVLERGVRPLIDLLASLQSRPEGAADTRDVIRPIVRHLAARPHIPALVQHEALTGGEALGQLARAWIRPLIAQGLLRMKADGESVWPEADHPHVIFAWLHLVFGYFAMAPLMREVLDLDPLAPESLDRHTDFLAQLATRVMSAPGSADALGEAAPREAAPRNQTLAPPERPR